jgi:hypothetical protein
MSHCSQFNLTVLIPYTTQHKCRLMGCPMHITTYTLDGQSGPEAELLQDDQGQLWLDGQAVLAVNLWGAKVALTLLDRLVLVALADYQRVTKYGLLSE